jgi:hypothetical protein
MTYDGYFFVYMTNNFHLSSRQASERSRKTKTYVSERHVRSNTLIFSTNMIKKINNQGMKKRKKEMIRVHTFISSVSCCYNNV